MNNLPRWIRARFDDVERGTGVHAPPGCAASRRSRCTHEIHKRRRQLFNIAQCHPRHPRNAKANNGPSVIPYAAVEPAAVIPGWRLSIICQTLAQLRSLPLRCAASRPPAVAMRGRHRSRARGLDDRGSLNAREPSAPELHRAPGRGKMIPPRNSLMSSHRVAGAVDEVHRDLRPGATASPAGGAWRGLQPLVR
jgi:hypothetical protein